MMSNPDTRHRNNAAYAVTLSTVIIIVAAWLPTVLYNAVCYYYIIMH